jgi:hypothetical protein
MVVSTNDGRGEERGATADQIELFRRYLLQAEDAFAKNKIHGAMTAISVAQLLFGAEFGQRSNVLDKLLKALDNVSCGHRDPFFEPSISHRPRDNSETSNFKLFAFCAMVARSRESGESLRKSAAWVAKAIAKAGYRVPGGKHPSADTVIGWRKKFKRSVDHTSFEEISKISDMHRANLLLQFATGMVPNR